MTRFTKDVLAAYCDVTLAEINHVTAQVYDRTDGRMVVTEEVARLLALELKRAVVMEPPDWLKAEKP